MPKYRITLSDGRKLIVESNAPPSEAQVMEYIASHPSGGKKVGEGITPEQAQVEKNRATSYNPNPSGGTFLKAAGKSALETAEKTGAGVLKGFKSVLDPRTYIGQAKEAVKERMDPRLDPPIPKGQSLKEVAKSASDPDLGGQMVGQLLTALIGGRVVPKIPGGMQKVGGALEVAADAAKPNSVTGAMLDYGMRGKPKEALAVGTIPYVASAAGKILKGGGGILKRVGSTDTNLVRPNMGPEPSIPLIEDSAVGNVFREDTQPSATGVSGGRVDFDQMIRDAQKAVGEDLSNPADEQNMRTNPQTGQRFAGDSPMHSEVSDVEQMVEGHTVGKPNMPPPAGEGPLRQQEITDKFGGKQPHDQSYTLRQLGATLDPNTNSMTDWHSGAEPGSSEATRASELHRADASRQSDFERNAMDEGLPDQLVMEELAKLLRGQRTGVGAP